MTCGEKQLSIAQTYIGAQKQHHKEASVIKVLEYCTAVDEGPIIVGMHVDDRALTVQQSCDWKSQPDIASRNALKRVKRTGLLSNALYDY